MHRSRSKPISRTRYDVFYPGKIGPDQSKQVGGVMLLSWSGPTGPNTGVGPDQPDQTSGFSGAAFWTLIDGCMTLRRHATPTGVEIRCFCYRIYQMRLCFEANRAYLDLKELTQVTKISHSQSSIAQLSQDTFTIITGSCGGIGSISTDSGCRSGSDRQLAPSLESITHLIRVCENSDLQPTID